MMTNEFWNSAGAQLLEVTDAGWLKVTPDFLRAYYMRPEVQPVDESCDNEFRLHEALMDDPMLAVSEERLTQLADQDAVENYRFLLSYRDILIGAGTIEGAYLKLIASRTSQVPSLFLDQLVHVILRHSLTGVSDPIRLRAAEIFFRRQNVSTLDERLMLADEEIVDMHARASNDGSGLHQLLAASGTESSKPEKRVELDVLDEDNADIYWQRSDNFDTVIDFRFGQPALDAFARVIEVWIARLANLRVRVQPVVSIEDSDWRWHIGMDVEANRILNLLYEGESLEEGMQEQIIGLFEMRIDDDSAVIEQVRGRPVYLGLAQTADNSVRMKPQNLLVNLPLVSMS